jgi:phage terminase large subunit GpA-like protein
MIDTLLSAFFRGLKPDPILTVSEWADEFRMLPSTVAEPGKFRMSRTPYNKEIADHLSVSSPVQMVVFKKCSQIGATETGNNWLGYIIHQAPAPSLYVMPTDTMMEITSKQRIQPMIDATPSLQHKIKPNKAKDSGNTIAYKNFEGGFVKMVGANSPVGLSSTAVRYVYADEVDRYPADVGGEGSAIKLAQTRTVTYGARKKIFITSTPTLDGNSLIDELFKTTGQRYYHVPCPHCGVMQKLVFEQLRWQKGNYSTEGVLYECLHCHETIAEHFKTKMLEDGNWIADVPEKEDGKTVGYHLNALYSPYGCTAGQIWQKNMMKAKIIYLIASLL